ncbi:hypothetical protein DFQ28_002344 [Apophysomyces sp. BC1034]|nr:hypothetical protein DFQ28_002344 [Apophysomyces sp. BC1034]
MHLSELKSQHVSALIEMANGLEIENANRLRKQELMFAILKKRAKTGETIFGDGTLEVLPDGFGFLRSPETSYLASTDDIYISPSQIRRFNLHTGDTIEGEVRTPKDGERYFALVKVDKVNGQPPEASKHKIMFENLTPLHPNKPLALERDMRGEESITGRIIDMIAPIGKGQRGLLVASPKSGKTVMLQHIAHAIKSNHPDVTLFVLLHHVLTGGVDANALQRPKRFFGAARNVEEGGSLTIIGTALTETGSRMDDVIYEEFKGTGNMEVHLERRLAEKRVYPSINLNKSGTRREELLIKPEILQKIWVLRKFIHDMDEIEAMEFLLDKLKQTKSNAEFFDMMRRGS